MLSICPSGGPTKNMLLVSTAFLLIFTGYNCSVNLLSSLSIDEGLGVFSQSILYAVFIVGSVTNPPLVMKTLGVKKTMAFSALLYAPYIGANFKPGWATFVPTAIVIGLAAGPLWASALSYLSAMAKKKAGAKSDAKAGNIVFLYMGILFMFFGMSNVFGNIVSFFILKPEGGYVETNITQEALQQCGTNFCDWSAIESGVIHQPPKDKINLLVGLYVGCVVAGGLLILLTIDDVPLEDVGISQTDVIPIRQLLIAPLKRLVVPEQIYLVPITIFAGLEESFLFGDFTKAYVACSWGVYHIGLCMISCGVVMCIFSPLSGWMVKIIDRAYIFVGAGLLQAGALVLLWVWTPEFPKYVLYIIPAIWGICTSVWQSQVRGLYGLMFPDAKGSAYALMMGLEALGFLIGFAISSKVCTVPKLALLAVVLALSILGYGAAEVSFRRKIAGKGNDRDADKDTKL